MKNQTRNDIVEAYNRIVTNMDYAETKMDACQYGSIEYDTWQHEALYWYGMHRGIMLALALLRSPSAPCGLTIGDMAGGARCVRPRIEAMTPEAVRLLAEQPGAQYAE